MKCSLDISNFLEEISSLSHAVVFLYFFALITEEGFLISPSYSLELCVQMSISFLFSFAFSLLFSAICKASSENHFAFLHFFFLGMVLTTASCTMSQTSINSYSGTLSDLTPWVCLSLPLYSHKGFDLAHQGCILLPCLFNLYAEYIMRNAGLEEAQAGIKLGEISITSDIQMTPPLWQKVKKQRASWWK